MLIIALFSFLQNLIVRRQDILVVFYSYFSDYAGLTTFQRDKQVFGGQTNFKVHSIIWIRNVILHQILGKSRGDDSTAHRCNATKVIICVDDAQKFVGSYYKNSPNISVIFGGVNAKEGSYGYDASAKNVTGCL